MLSDFGELISVSGELNLCGTLCEKFRMEEKNDTWTDWASAQVSFGNVLDSYCVMHEVVRKIFTVGEVTLEDRAGVERSQTKAGFLCFNDTLVFVGTAQTDAAFESCFVSLGLELPSQFFKDAFPESLDSISLESCVWRSSPSMLFAWEPSDVVPLRAEAVAADYHADVAVAKTSINKYMRRPVGLPMQAMAVVSEIVDPPPPLKQVNDPSAAVSNKRARDAREFREQILSNGAQAEFFVWSQIKAQYGSAADLSWWLTSTKRQFFPSDNTPIDDALGADFFVPRDYHSLFASRKGAAVFVEVKGTGRSQLSNGVTFEISRNELKKAQETPEGQEYVVAVISGLAGMGRPKLECIVRDFASLELVPTRFLATVPNNPNKPNTDAPPLTTSQWYH